MSLALADTDFQYIQVLLRDQAAIVLDDDKEYLVEARLGPVAKAEGLDDVGKLVARLRAGPSVGLRRKVVEAMAIHESLFFRDVHPFEALRTTILPELVARRADRRSLVIWSAACSMGQEPYSLAMILAEHFRNLAGWHVRVVATDLSEAAVERARSGCYSQVEINRGLPVAYLVKYFERQGLDWRVKDELRRMVDFRAMNLAAAWPALPTADLVLLRNVLIYFDQETKKAILSRMRRQLAPDGYLFLGAAETTHGLDCDLERALVGKTVCYRPIGSNNHKEVPCPSPNQSLRK